MTHDIGAIRRAVGEENRERIRKFFHDNPFATQRECAIALKMSDMAVGRHFKVLKAQHSEQHQSASA